MSTILLVDDELNIRVTLGANLRALGFQVIEAPDGAACLSAAAKAEVALVVLDLGLPDLDGLEVLRRLRSGSAVPVVVLSARDDQAQKVSALDDGADDYVTKPFDPPELAARIRAGLRRSAMTAAPPAVLHFGNYELDRQRRSLRNRGLDVLLTPNELGLLLVLSANPGRLLSHRFLLQAVWGAAYGTESTYLRTYMSQLRRKLGDDAARPTVIRTEPGLGYRWIAGGSGAD